MAKCSTEQERSKCVQGFLSCFLGLDTFGQICDSSKWQISFHREREQFCQSNSVVGPAYCHAESQPAEGPEYFRMSELRAPPRAFRLASPFKEQGSFIPKAGLGQSHTSDMAETRDF